MIGVAATLIAAKIVTNAAASLVFRWSVAGSVQLGFLLAQGSEFAFVVFSLPAVRDLMGSGRVSVAAAAVALSLAATPSMAAAGHALAGRQRMRIAKLHDPELAMEAVAAPVLIVGTGSIGRTLADALREFDIGCSAVERDQRRLGEAVADGYAALFGYMADPRLWGAIAMRGRRIVALTTPAYDATSELTPTARQLYPDLLHYAVLADDAEAQCFHALGVRAVVDRGFPPGLDLAPAVLSELGIDADALTGWMRRQQERALGGAGEALVAA